MPASSLARGQSVGRPPLCSRARQLRGPAVWLWLALTPVLGTACSHSEPFRPGSTGNEGPHDGTPPIRLTFDPGVDQYPAWLADGSGLLYSYQIQGTPDLDRCLGLLPPGGGSRRLEQCATGDIQHDSTNALLSSASAPGGLTAWVDVVGRRILAGPQGGGLRIGRRGDQLGARLVQAFPYVAPGGLRHAMATSLAWLGDSAVVYVGNELVYPSACSTCKLDTVLVGREIVLLKVDRDPAVLEIVTGTFESTSLSVAPDGSELYFTVAGDSRVFGRILGTGAVTVVHDFSALGIVRDVSVTATALVAIVGGQVAYFTDPQYGPMQVDLGGTLYHLALGTGQETPLSTPDRLVRHPAISPDGLRVVAEVTTTLQPGPPDLYLFSTP